MVKVSCRGVRGRRKAASGSIARGGEQRPQFLQDPALGHGHHDAGRSATRCTSGSPLAVLEEPSATPINLVSR